jgi:hypothetical protein
VHQTTNLACLRTRGSFHGGLPVPRPRAQVRGDPWGTSGVPATWKIRMPGIWEITASVFYGKSAGGHALPCECTFPQRGRYTSRGRGSSLLQIIGTSYSCHDLPWQCNPPYLQIAGGDWSTGIAISYRVITHSVHVSINKNKFVQQHTRQLKKSEAAGRR